MPKPQIDLSPFQDLITTWFNDGISTEDIAQRLQSEHNTSCTDRTIRRRLKDWGVTQRVRIKETAALRLKIASMFYMNFPDDIIVRALNEEGYQIGKSTVVRIRKAQGYKRRMSVWERVEANSELWGIVQEELDKGEIEGYGKELLQKYFRMKGLNTTRYCSLYIMQYYTNSYIETPSFQLLSSLIQLVLYVVRMTLTAKEESILFLDRTSFGLLMDMTS